MDSPAKLVKDRLNIVDVVGAYVQLRKAGRNYTARCPFHKERTPSFMVSPERGTYICFGCGEKGDIFSFVEKIEGVDFKTALIQLAEKAGVTLPKYSGPRPEEKEKAERLREACEAATLFFEAKLKERSDVQDYIRKRGIKDETAAAWRVGYAPASWEDLSKHLLGVGFNKDEAAEAGLAATSEKKPGEIYDRFRGRIMFPIFDLAGKPVAFSGRFFEKVPGSHEEGEPAKYVNSPETELFKKSRVLYGLDRAKENIRKLDCILMVEGQFDVVLSHQSGLKFAVAVSGTALTEEHLTLLSRYSKRLVLALDNDAAGLKAGLKSSAMALRMGFDVKIPRIEGGKDPADLAAKDPELLRAAVRGSTPAVEFFLGALRPQAKDERAFKKLVEAEVLPLIAAIPSRIDQAHFIQLVAGRLGIPEDAVRAEVLKRPQAASVRESADAGAASSPEFQPLEKAAGMLLFHFGEDSSMRERLKELMGAERLSDMSARLEPHAELLRFLFDSEVGEHTTEAAVSQDLLKQVELQVVEEELAAADKNDLRRITELARRKEELRG